MSRGGDDDAARDRRRGAANRRVQRVSAADCVLCIGPACVSVYFIKHSIPNLAQCPVLYFCIVFKFGHILRFCFVLSFVSNVNLARPSAADHFKKLGGAAPAAALRAAFVASKLWRVCLLIAAARPEFRALRSNVMASVAMQRLLAEGDSGAQDASAKTAPVEENDAIDRSRPALAASPLSMPLSERALWALALESSAACAAADSSLATIGMFEAVFGAADSAAVSTHLASAVGFSEDALFCANLLLLSAPFRKESTAVRGASVAALSPTFSASLATPPIDTVSALHRILRAALQRANAALSELSLAQTAAAAAAASVGINSSRNDADDDENDKRTRPPTQGIKISSELRSRIAAAVAESPSSPSPPTAAAAAAAAAAPASSSSTRPIPIHAHESASESTSKAAEVRLARTKRVRAALKQLVYDWSASANSNASSQAARKSD